MDTSHCPFSPSRVFFLLLFKGTVYRIIDAWAVSTQKHAEKLDSFLVSPESWLCHRECLEHLSTAQTVWTSDVMKAVEVSANWVGTLWTIIPRSPPSPSPPGEGPTLAVIELGESVSPQDQGVNWTHELNRLQTLRGSFSPVSKPIYARISK